MENFGKFMSIVFVIIFSTIINGFVFSKLWLWFIVPTFQIHPLRVVEAIGITLLINFFLLNRGVKSDDKFWEKFASNIINLILMAGFVLFTGWVVTLFL